MVMHEKQTCPRRVDQGKDRLGVGLDSWSEGRWSNNIEPDKWKWPWIPRTCSYCGCIHPEDAIKLLDELWEPWYTIKAYKIYLEPPGTGFKHNQLMKVIGDGDGEDRIFSLPGWSPVPPVKFYSWHGSEEQLKKINELARRNAIL